MKKIILVIVLVLILVVVVGVVMVGRHLGDIVKAGLETAGPKVTQTSLTVSAVNVSLLGGSAGISGLVLGNPEGCKSPQAISIGKAAVSLSPGSILSDKVVIHSIEVRDADITFESEVTLGGNPLKANNLAKIMDNVNAATKSADNAAAPAANAAPAGTTQPGKKLQVDDVLITGAKVHATLTGMVNKEVTVTLPDIHLTDLGKGGDGITAGELIKKILGQIDADTVKALLASVGDLGKNAAQQAISGALTNVNKSANDSVKQLKKGLGNLLEK